MGLGGHGSRPNECNNPIKSAAEVYLEIEKRFSKYKEGHQEFSYSITTINAGIANNVIPNSCHMTGSIRTHIPEDVKGLPELMEQCVKDICAKNDTTYKIRFEEISDNALYNNAKCTQFLRKVARDFYGEEAVSDIGPPSKGSEDFADYLDVVPGCFFWRVLNNAQADTKLHTSKFNFDDGVIEDVAEFYTQLVLTRLNMEN